MMPGAGSTANVNYNMQGLENYYLQGGSPTTLTPFMAGVQNHAETLFLASQTGQFAANAGATEVASTIVFPSSAQIWIGTASAPVTVSPGKTLAVSAGSTIFLQVTNSGQSDGLVTGIRFLLSTDLAGNTISLTLANDGSAYNALRITGSTPPAPLEAVTRHLRFGPGLLTAQIPVATSTPSVTPLPRPPFRLSITIRMAP
jgi:hypothetical protein